MNEKTHKREKTILERRRNGESRALGAFPRALHAMSQLTGHVPDGGDSDTFVPASRDELSGDPSRSSIVADLQVFPDHTRGPHFGEIRRMALSQVLGRFLSKTPPKRRPKASALFSPNLLT